MYKSNIYSSIFYVFEEAEQSFRGKSRVGNRSSDRFDRFDHTIDFDFDHIDRHIQSIDIDPLKALIDRFGRLSGRSPF
jgi:hypothetical protein